MEVELTEMTPRHGADPPEAAPIETGEVVEPQREDNDTAEAAIGAPLALRLSLVKRILSSASDLGIMRRLMLLGLGVLALAQVVGFSTVAGLTQADDCDEPLRLYLILSAVRIAIAFPLSFYSALVPRVPARGDTPERRAELENSRRLGTISLDRRVRQVSDICAVSGLILFVLGNWWFFSQRTCRATAPMIYYTAMAGLVISWTYAAEVVLLVVSVLFFLPLVLVIMRALGVGEKTVAIGPLTSTQIKTLPLCIYVHKPDPQPTEEGVVADSSTAAPTPVVTSRRRSFWRLLRSRSRATPPPATDGIGFVVPPGVQVLPLTQHMATCAICLSDYTEPPATGTVEAESWEPELLRLLPCSHAFHRDCLDDWLVVSGRCPVCQHPVLPSKTKKGAAEESPSSSSSSV